MPVLVKTKLDLSDSDDLHDLALIVGNADFSFITERILLSIVDSGKAKEFGEYFKTEMEKEGSSFRTCFDKEKFFNIWAFFREIDLRAEEIISNLSLPIAI